MERKCGSQDLFTKILPYGVDIPKDWILSNPKHNKY